MADKKRPRSPNFPYSAISDCIDAIKTLHNSAQITQLPTDLALKKMGLNPTSSTSSRMMSSMISYGLLNDEGSGKNKRVYVSELGRRIVVDVRQDSQERLEAVQEAVLNDPMMLKMWEKWKRSLPRDQETIITVLQLDYGFSSERAASRFASVIKDNYQFAQLDEYYTNTNTVNDNGKKTQNPPEKQDELSSNPPASQSGVENNIEAPATKESGLTKYPIPLDGSRFAYIYLPSEVSINDAEYIPDYVNLLLKKIKKTNSNR